MQRQPLETELAAAAAVAVKAGMGLVSPELLHVGNHTTALLRPWPVVARIASGTSFDLEGAGIAQELAIAAHLARRGAPTVRPATAVHPGPYFEQECAITLWEFADGRAVAGEAEESLAAAALREVQHALADVPVDLPTFLEKVDSCETILADPDRAAELPSSDRVFLRSFYRRRRETLGDAGRPWRPLHGDAHVGNARIVGSRAIWMDIESVCVGPLEWDVAFLPQATWSSFTDADQALIGLLADVRDCCVAVWCWAEFGRSAATNEAAFHHLARLKARFP
jgi:hypothetical protein